MCQLCQQKYLRSSMLLVHVQYITAARRDLLRRMSAVQPVQDGMKQYLETLTDCHNPYVYSCSFCLQFLPQNLPTWFERVEKVREETGIHTFDPDRVNIIVQHSSDGIKQDPNRMEYRHVAVANEFKWISRIERHKNIGNMDFRTQQRQLSSQIVNQKREACRRAALDAARGHGDQKKKSKKKQKPAPKRRQLILSGTQIVAKTVGRSKRHEIVLTKV